MVLQRMMLRMALLIALLPVGCKQDPSARRETPGFGVITGNYLEVQANKKVVSVDFPAGTEIQFKVFTGGGPKGDVRTDAWGFARPDKRQFEIAKSSLSKELQASLKTDAGMENAVSSVLKGRAGSFNGSVTSMNKSAWNGMPARDFHFASAGGDWKRHRMIVCDGCLISQTFVGHSEKELTDRECQTFFDSLKISHNEEHAKSK